MTDDSDVWDSIADLCDRYDADVRFEAGSGAAWSGELRLTLTDPPGAPSRSIVFYKAGGGSPESCARALIADYEAWLKESDVEPLPVPDWLQD